jgi:sugar lactone lactonase YvrE
LYWIDNVAHTVMRQTPGGELQRWDLPSTPGCIAPMAQGGLVLALRDGIYSASIWGGPLSLMQAAPYDRATTRFNDGKCDPLGRLWAGTMYEPRDKALGALYTYALGANGELTPTLKADTVTIANGLAWSPDLRTLYWADTAQHIIRAWDWDAASNVLSAGRVFHQFAFKPEGWVPGLPDNGGYLGRPDGASVDANGDYWVAMFEGGCVLQMSPQGVIKAQWPTPALCPTMPCFGGDDLRTMYLTTARHNRPAAELAQFPLSGCVLTQRVDVPGLSVNFFTPG